MLIIEKNTELMPHGYAGEYGIWPLVAAVVGIGASVWSGSKQKKAQQEAEKKAKKKAKKAAAAEQAQLQEQARILALQEEEKRASRNKIIKIVAITGGVIIIGIAGYFVYKKTIK